MQPEFHWAMLVSAAAGFAIGAVWYLSLGGPWMRAVGRTREELRPSPVPFAAAAAANLLIAFVLGNLMRMFEISSPVTAVVPFGLLFWGGFALPFLVMNYAFARRSMLTLIDGGQALVNLCAQAAILAWLGVGSSGYY